MGTLFCKLRKLTSGATEQGEWQFAHQPKFQSHIYFRLALGVVTGLEGLLSPQGGVQPSPQKPRFLFAGKYKGKYESSASQVVSAEWLK